MRKELASATQLADMITNNIGASDVEVVVRKDHAYGWQPNVVAAPGHLIGFQRRAEEIAKWLRVSFDLRE
jgi:hypothetical protein